MEISSTTLYCVGNTAVENDPVSRSLFLRQQRQALAKTIEHSLPMDQFPVPTNRKFEASSFSKANAS